MLGGKTLAIYLENKTTFYPYQSDGQVKMVRSSDLPGRAFILSWMPNELINWWTKQPSPELLFAAVN